ncbi:MAG: hypothetical protein LW688_05040 [Cryomorphaceae bacterium]|jgi:hypothetical protein|nr:hypothetical protein [Cryomorphaceae bacterium]
MGLLSNFFDRFNASDFDIQPNQKVKTVQQEFKENFGLTLRIYKGKQLADPELTFAQLDHRTSKKVNWNSDDLRIKANMTIAQVEKMIDENFGLTVQVANEFDTYNVGNHYTLGQASRKEDLEDWCKKEGYANSAEYLKKEGVSSWDEWYAKNKK